MDSTFLGFLLSFQHTLTPENDVRADCYPFLPGIDFNLIVNNYLFAADTANFSRFFESAKVDPKKILVLKVFLKISRNFKILWLVKVSEMPLLIYHTTLLHDLEIKASPQWKSITCTFLVKKWQQHIFSKPFCYLHPFYCFRKP